MGEDSSRSVDRRTVLSLVASGATASMAGCSMLAGRDDGPVSDVDDERAESLAEQFAPTLYFDANERWFPTDPRTYESEQDGATVVDGFDALNGYVEAGGEDPTDATVFYNVVEYDESPLAVVQYWFYAVFDQFTTNFHWHDWELLQVFVDVDSGTPQLYVASSHSRSVPNNEYLDPDGQRRPRILSELGSHSSGLSVNEDAEHFQRLPFDDGAADITNSVIDAIEDVAAIPLAYGLPRDEGLALPYVVPELDGAPFYEHDRLPSVDASNLVPEELTVHSFGELGSPPDLAGRETGYRFDFRGAADADAENGDAEGDGAQEDGAQEDGAQEDGAQGTQDGAADVTYDLQPSADLEHIEDFTGPQLSFEFAIPGFVEDAIAGHITTTGVPWTGRRYTEPASDISEPAHRQALADRYDAIAEPSPVNQVVAVVTNAVSADEAPDGGGLTTVSSPLEMFALLESEPEAVPTFNGVAVVQDVPDGDHSLTINGAGVAPHGETVTVGDGDVTVAGVEGEIPLVAREYAVKMAVDPTTADSDLTDLAVEDDFAGRLYDAPLSGPDAVFVHRGGAFTAEVRDSDDELGAFRVDPGDEERVRVEDPRTGKAPLATYLADVAAETRDEVAAADGGGGGGSDGDSGDGTDDDGGGRHNSVEGLANALDAVADAARRAADDAAAGNRGNADRNLETVSTRLDRVATRLSEARGSLPDDVARATDNRLAQARRRNGQARDAEKL